MQTKERTCPFLLGIRSFFPFWSWNIQNSDALRLWPKFLKPQKSKPALVCGAMLWKPHHFLLWTHLNSSIYGKTSIFLLLKKTLADTNPPLFNTKHWQAEYLVSACFLFCAMMVALWSLVYGLVLFVFGYLYYIFTRILSKLSLFLRSMFPSRLQIDPLFASKDVLYQN